MATKLASALDCYKAAAVTFSSSDLVVSVHYDNVGPFNATCVVTRDDVANAREAGLL